MTAPENAPGPGEVGAWHRLPDGSHAQVWALLRTGRGAAVWLADGKRFVAVALTDLAVPDPEQPSLLEEE